jgi:transcriptional regulator with XRE-family HTH domain
MSMVISSTREIYPTQAQLECRGMAKLTLQNYVKRVMKEAGISLRDVERNSHGKISSGYVNDITLGEAKNVTPEKLIALAKGLRRPLAEVLDVVFGDLKEEEISYRDTSIRTLLAEFNSLPDSDQKELKVTVDMLLKEVRQRKTAKDNGQARR